MLFRHDPPPSRVAERFRSGDGVFTVAADGGVQVVRVATSLEHSVDLLHALAEHLPPLVDCSIECVRTKRRYVGEGLSLPEVRDAVARLKVPLVASGGVELAVYTDEDQLVLDPMLELWIYSRTDRWVYLLVGAGLEVVETVPRRSWRVARDEFTGGRELVDAVEKTAERLTLRLV